MWSCPLSTSCTTPIPTVSQSYEEIQDFLYSDCSPSIGPIINNLDKVFTNITWPANSAQDCQYSYDSKPKINFPNEFQYCNNTWPPVVRTTVDGPYIKVEKKMNDASNNTYDLKLDRPYSLCYYDKSENTTCEMRCGSGGTRLMPFAQFDLKFPCNCDSNCALRKHCCGGDWDTTKQYLCDQRCKGITYCFSTSDNPSSSQNYKSTLPETLYLKPFDQL